MNSYSQRRQGKPIRTATKKATGNIGGTTDDDNDDDDDIEGKDFWLVVVMRFLYLVSITLSFQISENLNQEFVICTLLTYLLVVGVSTAEPRSYFFRPVDEEWQATVAGLLGNEKPVRNFYTKRAQAELMEDRLPRKLKNNKGLGACLPRTLSLAIYGDGEHHQRLRDAVVDFILQGPLPGERKPRDNLFFQRMEEMRLTKTWMTCFEIEAYAFMLNTPIYSCVLDNRTIRSRHKKYYWQRLPHFQCQGSFPTSLRAMNDVA